MDQKTALILNIGKYGGYMAVLWVAVSHGDLVMNSSIYMLIAVMALDSIRYFYLESKFKNLGRSSIFLQLLFIFVFIFLDGSSVGSILLVIIVAESLLTYSRPTGDHIFFLAIVGFIVVSALGFYWRSELTWVNMSIVLINCLFLLFAYAVSYMARRQLEEKERAESALQQLDHSRAELETAYVKLIEISKEREHLAATEERSRLARELHDTLAHTLTAIVVTLEAGKKLLHRDLQKALAEIDKSQEQARKGLDQVRQTMKALRPGDFEGLDFAAALKNLARDYSGSGIEVKFELDEDLQLSGQLEFSFYRIIQESITNSIRHGQADLITVRLQRDAKELILEVEDNGKGCANLVEGYGIRGMRERAAAAGARIEFVCPGQTGFLVRLTLEKRVDEKRD